MSKYATYKNLFDYISIRSCPHDIIHGEDYYKALLWTQTLCEGMNHKCVQCWEKFIREFMKDE